MTLLLFDTEAMDQTAGMLRDGAGEYEVLSSQVRADADLGSMPAQTAAWVSDVIASVSQTLSQLTSDLSSDAELLAWRSEEARLADDPSLGALADAIFGLTSAVGLSSLFANTAEGYAAGVDPLGVPAGCAGCVGGYAAATYEPPGGEPTGDTSSSSAWGEGSYQTIYSDPAGGNVTIGGGSLDDGVSGSAGNDPGSVTIGGTDLNAGVSGVPVNDPGFFTIGGTDVGMTAGGSQTVTIQGPSYDPYTIDGLTIAGLMAPTYNPWTQTTGSTYGYYPVYVPGLGPDGYMFGYR